MKPSRIGEQNMVGNLTVRRRFRAFLVTSVAALSATLASAQGGLALPDSAGFGSRFQARVGITASSSPDVANPAWQQQAGVLLGDYYFARVRFGRDVSGGFRATSGMLVGQRSLALGTPALATGQRLSLTMLRQQRQALPVGESLSEGWSAVPYLGVGYSGVSVRGGWGLTADVGLAATRSSAGGLRVGTGPALDDVLREVRLAPMLHLGVSYAF
jgi:hypothetical protein